MWRVKSKSVKISFHIPVVLLSFIPPLLNLGELLLPIHIILLELIVHPVSAFTFENFSNTSVKVSKALIDKKTVLTSVAAGVLVSVLALLVFVFMPDLAFEEKRAIAFTTVMLGNIGFILLETRKNVTRRLLITIILLLIVSISIVKVPFLSMHLHFTP